MKVLAGFLSIISAASLLASCLSEEGFATMPTSTLQTSVDTLSLDTVIAGEPTNTYTFQVYNPSEENLRIRRIFLQHGEASPFRINVDGTFLQGGSGSNWEIYGNDSLRVFVELTAPETSYDSPQGIEDKLSFELENGNTKVVTLKAAGQRVVRLPLHTLERDTTLNARVPYLIKDSLVVASNTTLTLAAGTRLYFHSAAKLIVHGSLVAQGTAQQNIQFRGDRMGYMFSNQPYDRIPGQWGGIVLKEQSQDNKLDFCDIHSGDFGIICDSSSLSKTKLTLTNSVIHNTSGDGLQLNSCVAVVGNSQITNAGGNCVSILGGNSQFTHCTIGQFYALAGGRGVALNISNSHDEQLIPIERAEFRNCLITGYNADDINVTTSSRFSQEDIKFYFDHCVLNTPTVADDPRVNACIFESEIPENERREKHFWPAFDLDKLLFSFTLRSNGVISDKADVNLTRETFPFDRLGRPRIINNTAAPGCYAPIAETSSTN